MKYSVNELTKMVQGLKERVSAIDAQIDKYATFHCALQEKLEDVKPNYDIVEAMAKKIELNKKIRNIKHILNVHNSTTKLKGYDLTIDEVLIYIPQLAAEKSRLYSLSAKPEKERAESRFYGEANTSIIDYVYTNYDHAVIDTMFNKKTEELSAIYTALDESNSEKTIEIDF